MRSRRPSANKAVIEQMKASAVRKSAKEKTGAEQLATQLSEVELVFERKVGENDHLFGSVTSGDIAQQLEAKGFTIDRRKISLEEPLKTDRRVPCAGEAASRSDQPRQGDGQGRSAGSRSHHSVIYEPRITKRIARADLAKGDAFLFVTRFICNQQRSEPRQRYSYLSV